jgi:DNA ligase-1
MEKLDGVRVFWDGKALYTKDLKKISPPSQFVNKFPTIPFEGELRYVLINCI